MTAETILTDEQIKEQFEWYVDDPEHTNTFMVFARAIEEAILTKLAEQTPVIYLYDGDLYSADDMGINGHIREHGTPLYARPMPSRQAVNQRLKGE